MKDLFYPRLDAYTPFHLTQNGFFDEANEEHAGQLIDWLRASSQEGLKEVTEDSDFPVIRSHNLTGEIADQKRYLDGGDTTFIGIAHENEDGPSFVAGGVLVRPAADGNGRLWAICTPQNLYVPRDPNGVKSFTFDLGRRGRGLPGMVMDAGRCVVKASMHPRLSREQGCFILNFTRAHQTGVRVVNLKTDRKACLVQAAWSHEA